MDSTPALASFLEALKLPQLLEMFHERDISTVEQLIELSDEGFKDLGVEKPGHRKRIINELKNIRLRIDIVEKGTVHLESEEDEVSNGKFEKMCPESCSESNEAAIPVSLSEEEVDVVQGSPPVGSPTDVLPPIPPKRLSKNAPPAPLPRGAQSESAGNKENMPPHQPQTPVLRKDHSEDNDICYQSPNTTEASDSSEVPMTVKSPESKDELGKKESPMQATPPVIPPRVDLEEGPSNLNVGFISKDDISRSQSMPKKRPAPPPPSRAPSQKDKPVTKWKNEQVIESSEKVPFDVTRKEMEKPSDASKKFMRPSSISVVRNSTFMKSLNSKIASPVRPAPVPPQLGTNETKTVKDGREDGSSDSDEGAAAQPEGVQKIQVRNPPAMKSKQKAEDVSFENKRFSKMPVDTKSGFLEKRGGQNNQKALKKRWVDFDGNDLRYYKPNDKDTKSDCLQIVPVHRMLNVTIESSGKRGQFCLETPNRTFIFTSDDHNEVGLWANILMKAIYFKDQNPAASILSTSGGAMADPDKEGWLKKQGHNVAKDWKGRYIVVKGGTVAYYYSYEDFTQDIPINCLNMALSTIRQEPSRFRITIKTAEQKDFLFEATDEASYQSWVTAFETSIQFALGDTTVLKALQDNPTNGYCADCGKRNPVWASVNLLVIVCDNCIGFHRKLGAQISKARSILMDEKIWSSSLKEMMQTVGNQNANSFWEYNLPDDDRISPDASSNERYDFISAKYKERKYISFSQFYGQSENLGEALRCSVVTNDVLSTLKLIICGASVYYTAPGNGDQRTPYELATAANQDLQMEILRQFNGHYTAEERKKEEEEKIGRQQKDTEMSPVQHVQDAWEKQGVLSKRGPKNSEPWRKRVFYLKRRSLYYQTDKDRELIDLKEVIDIQLGANDNDPTTINIVLPNRTFYLKAESISETKSWYWAIKNKQVFGVDIACQALNSRKIPLLVAKCIDYVEHYAMQEVGIYRKSGSFTTIKSLRLAFDQDAPGIRLSMDNYPNVHDVCCLLKLYLREGLPEPLMTEKLYKSFIANSFEAERDPRPSALYNLIRRLPETNLCTLTKVVVHLNKVIKKSDENEMNKDNINRIFAPIILNQGNSTNAHELNKEYAVFNALLTHDTYFFDIDPSEEAKKDQDIENAMKILNDAMKQSNKDCKIDEIQVSVSIENTQRSCMVKVNSKTTASEICWYIIKLMSLSFDSNWSLYEKIDGAGLERPLHTKELVFPLVMESSKWESSQWMLVLRNNYVAEMTSPYQDNMLSIAGKLHWRKKDSSWKEYFFKIRTGDLIVLSKENGSEIEKLPLHLWLLYIGNDERSKKKSPKEYGFSLMNGSERRYICTSDEKYMYRWISAILQIKYPSGIWTNLRDAERRMTAKNEEIVPLDQRKSVFLGRQAEENNERPHNW